MSTATRTLVVARDLLLASVTVAGALPIWLLPWRPAIALGRIYGVAVWLFWPSARRVAAINLRRAFGIAMTRPRAARWTRTILANLGQSVAEGLQFSRRFHRAGAGFEHLYDAEDPELERRIRADARPKIFVTGHLGSWEVALMVAGLHARGPAGVVGRHLDNVFLDAIVRRVRLPRPARWIDKRNGALAALHELRAGRSVALLLDENAGYRGIFVNFWGRPASTWKTPALLALMTGAPIVVGAAVRQATRRLTFKLSLIEPPVGAPADAETVRQLTQQIVSTLERWIREDPLQWRWIHWRWKTRPDGREEAYGRSDLEHAFRVEAAPPSAAGEVT